MLGIINAEFTETSSPNDLLDAWVIEQSNRFDKLHKQLKLIPRLSANQLDDLADRLDDIQYHIAALSNILDLLVGYNNEPHSIELPSIDLFAEQDEQPQLIELPSIDLLAEQDEQPQLIELPILNLLVGHNNETSSYEVLNKKCPLLLALFFHSMMVIDPDSIYYSTKFRDNAWDDTYHSH